MSYKGQILPVLFFCFFINILLSSAGFTRRDGEIIFSEKALINPRRPDLLQADFNRPRFFLSSVEDRNPDKTVCREKRHKKSRKVEIIMPVLSVGVLKNFFSDTYFHFPPSQGIPSNQGLGFSLRGPPRGFENI
jgi:hypothetical protein